MEFLCPHVRDHRTEISNVKTPVRFSGVAGGIYPPTTSESPLLSKIGHPERSTMGTPSCRASFRYQDLEEICVQRAGAEIFVVGRRNLVVIDGRIDMGDVDPIIR